MENKYPRVSIIIPVYNDEKYLQQCVDSVLGQSYQNFEVILVNDGSTDYSGDICDKYAEKDSRVKVLHKDNAGPAFARESGLKVMTGEYVIFVDSDDWIDSDTISVCLQALSRYPHLDCVLFSYIKEYEESAVSTHLFDKSAYMKGTGLQYKVYRRLFGLTSKELVHPERMETMASCWGKLYTADCVAKARYFDLKSIGSSEDALFNMYALYGIKEAVYIDRCLYHYRKRANAQTSAYRPNLPKQWKNLFCIMEGIIDEKRLDDSYREVLSNRIALSIMAITLNELSNENSATSVKIKNIRDYLRDRDYQENCQRISVRHMPLPWKIFIICAKLKLSIPIYVMARLSVIIRKKRRNEYI